MDKKNRPPESRLEKAYLEHIKGRTDRTAMVDLIEDLYQQAYSEHGMSLESQRYITKLLRDAARFADDPEDREARNNPIARVLKLSGKRDSTQFEHQMAKALHWYVREKNGERGALAYAIAKLRESHPKLDDLYKDDGTLRRIYNKHDPKKLDDALLMDYMEICNK